jgi:RNA recognition motif-containing protein
MTKSVYVGNLSFGTTQEGLRELFGAHGQVATVNMVTYRYTGQPRGFAFVKMMTEEGANAAIGGLNGLKVGGRALKVAWVKARECRDPDQGGDNRGW